ncbi:MAG: hypothetical protein J1E82_07975 [Muribaculaceae bacterium]|nr:hypothetical protein [Muribaculaceae bacterium]
MKKFTTLAKMAAVFLLGSAAFSANAQTEIVPGEAFFVDSVDPVWIYTPIVDVPNFYFTVNDFEYDVFEDVEPWGPGLVFATDQNGENPIELTPVKKANGEYVYTGTNLEVGTNYYMILKEQYSTFGMTLYLEEYVPEEQPDYKPITVGEAFTLSPADQYYKYFSLSEEDFYLVTNSDVNLLNGGLVINYQGMNIFADWMQVEAVETEDGYVYTGLYAQSLENYEFIYSGTETIEMTLYTGTYGGGSGEPEVSFPEIVPGEKFFVDSDEPVWVYTPTENVANFYITVDDFEFNVFEDDLITFSTDAKGMISVPLTAESAPKGEFVYLGTDLEAGQSYYIVLKDEYSGFNLALYTEEYVPAEQPDYKSITVGEAFTLSPADQYYKYFSLSEEDFYLVTNSDVNLLEGGLVINYQGMNIFADWMQVEAIETDDGYVYTGLYAQSLENYEFVYSGTETIEMTLYTGTYGGGSGSSDYMENYADQYTTVINADDPYSAVELSWGVPVTLIADYISVPVWYNGDIKGILTAEYFQLQGGDAGNPGISAAAETGDNGTVLFILTGASELFTDPGTYLMTIPEGLFADAEGNVNKEQDVVVTVIAYVEGSSEQDGAEFAQGEDVTIVIDFDEEVTINEDNAEEFAILVTNYMDYDELIALDADNVEISGNQIIINLGNELPLGFYELSLREGVVLSGDNPNAGTYVYFSVAEGGTDGIFGLNAEELKNAAIYNLNGVRVDANKLTKGIYIINGKKVLVK